MRKIENLKMKGNKKIIIVCKKHGDFLQNVQNHLFGSGCPTCHFSKGEIKIENFSYIMWSYMAQFFLIQSRGFNAVENPNFESTWE